MTEHITQKQKEVYDFLVKYTTDKGFPPSVRDICTALSLKSTSTVHGHLKRLENKGLIYRDPTKPRALEILELSKAKKEMLNIPIIGRVTAGAPILATENIEDIFQLPLNYVKHSNDLFILKVVGTSMIEAGILDGDLAIIEQTNVAINGEIVVALIDNEATIKTFYKEKNYYRLQPENSTMEPIIVTECSVLGKLVGLYREY